MSIASLYPSINPSLLLDFANSKVLDSRVTFTRTTTATYYDGVTTAKAEENLFTYSQNSTTNWTNFSSRLTITTSYEAAPDGTTTGMRLVNSSGSTGYFYQNVGSNILVSGTTYTLSVYVKSNTGSSQTISLMIPDTGTTTNVTATTTWSRVSWTPTLASTNSFAGLVLSNGADISVWGFQLEQRSSATAYTTTTTQAITNYIPVLQTAAAGQARFDHNPTTGESLGLLIEEARTNLATYSADFSNAAWTKSGGSITLNGNVAPDGTVSADIFVENTSNSTHELGQAFTINMTSTAYTMSIYVKANGRTRGSIFMVAPGPTYQQFGCNFNLTAQTATVSSANGGVASSATITPVGNDWYRITATGYTTYNGSQTFAFYLQDSSGNVVYTGNGFSGMSIWGAQLEAGSFATSYIPTVASSVTRNADAASMTGTNFSSWFNAAEGTLFCNATDNGYTQDAMTYTIADGSTANLIQAYRNPTGTRSFAITASNSASTILTASVSTGTPVLSAFAYKVDSFALSTNGSAASTDSSGVVPYSLNVLNIGNRNSSLYQSQTIKKLAYYPIRVTNAQLQALTV